MIQLDIQLTIQLHAIHFDHMELGWLVGLKLIQLEQQKNPPSLIILANDLKPILCRVIKGA